MKAGLKAGMGRQRGLTLIGLILILSLIAMAALVGFKLLPVYTEFFNVKRIVSEIAASPEAKGASLKQLQIAFDRRALIDSVSSVKGADLEMQKTGDAVSLSLSWERKVPLVANVSVLVEFQVES